MTLSSIFPAPRPRLATEGVTRPNTSKGTINLRICAKKTLNVLNILIMTSGAISPNNEPIVIAINTLGNNPSFLFFILSIFYLKEHSLKEHIMWRIYVVGAFICFEYCGSCRMGVPWHGVLMFSKSVSALCCRLRIRGLWISLHSILLKILSMKKNILLSGILLLSFSCAVAQDYHDDVVVRDSVKVM